LGAHGPTRRSVLGTTLLGGMAGAAVPLVSGCGGQATAAQPPDRELATLRTVIAAEQRLVTLYATALHAEPRMADTLRRPLRHHRTHLSQLRGRLAGATPSPSGSADPHPADELPHGSTAIRHALRTAEHDAWQERTKQLMNVSPSFAQLLASIAACEYSHISALTD